LLGFLKKLYKKNPIKKTNLPIILQNQLNFKKKTFLPGLRVSSIRHRNNRFAPPSNEQRTPGNFIPFIHKHHIALFDNTAYKVISAILLFIIHRLSRELHVLFNPLTTTYSFIVLGFN